MNINNYIDIITEQAKLKELICEHKEGLTFDGNDILCSICGQPLVLISWKQLDNIKKNSNENMIKKIEDWIMLNKNSLNNFKIDALDFLRFIYTI